MVMQSVLLFQEVYQFKGGYLICSGVPPDVALVMAHAASFLVRNSAFCKISMSTGKMLASITVCNRDDIYKPPDKLPTNLKSRLSIWLLYLDLRSVPSCDVGDGPAGFFFDGFLWSAE